MQKVRGLLLVLIERRIQHGDKVARRIEMSEDQTTEENVSRETTVGQQIETNNTPTTPTTPTSESAPTEEQSVESMGERPAWLPEKFKSAEDMANSYSQLEGKLSQKEEDIKITSNERLGSRSI